MASQRRIEGLSRQKSKYKRRENNHGIGAIIEHPQNTCLGGVREMAISTPDGHRLVANQILDHREPD